MTLNAYDFEELVLNELEELPTVSRDRWQQACDVLEANGFDPSLLDEFARDERT